MDFTKSELVAAFTEWDRRYREEPDRFISEATRLLKTDANTYGELAAPYLLEILKEQRKGQPPTIELAHSLKLVKDREGGFFRLYIDGQPFRFATRDGFTPTHPENGLPGVLFTVVATQDAVVVDLP